MAYRLNLIDLEMRTALDLVRKVRNDFAHSIETATLSDAPHKDRVRDLKNLTEHSQLWKDTYRPLMEDGGLGLESEDLASFSSSMAVILAGIELAEVASQPVTAQFTASFDLWR